MKMSKIKDSCLSANLGARLHAAMLDTFGTPDYEFIKSLNHFARTRGFLTFKQKMAFRDVMSRHWKTAAETQELERFWNATKQKKKTRKPKHRRRRRRTPLGAES